MIWLGDGLELSERVAERVRRLMREGRRIEAIKAVRSELGCGFKQGKEIVRRLTHG